MVDQGVVEERTSWHPWYASDDDASPAGYATNYDVVSQNNGTLRKLELLNVNGQIVAATAPMFSFVTIRLAGHEVPHYTPRAAYALFQKFLKGTTF